MWTFDEYRRVQDTDYKSFVGYLDFQQNILWRFGAGSPPNPNPDPSLVSCNNFCECSPSPTGKLIALRRPLYSCFELWLFERLN